MRLGVGAQQGGGATNTSILSDAFEAYVGVLYLKMGIENVTAFLETQHIVHVDRADAAEADAKTALQEFTQARYFCGPDLFRAGRGAGPTTAGLPHRYELPTKSWAKASARRRKAAQQSAAAMALASLRNREPEPEPEPPETPPPSPRVLIRRSRDRSPSVPQENEGTHPNHRCDSSKLKVFGFKTFAEATTLDFTAGITGGRRSQWLGQIESGRRDPLGARRAIDAFVALAEDGRRHLLGQPLAQAARYGRSLADVR